LTQYNRLRIGTEIRDENIISNKLGDTLSNPVKIKGTDNLYYIKGDNRLIYNLFADHALYLNRFTISGGFNYSYCSNFKGNWSYGIDAAYRLVEKLKIYTSANRSFRNPTFNDLYYESPTNYGNPNLKPESAMTYEGGLKFDYTLLSGNAGYFHREGKNIIDWIKLPTETKWHTKNYTSLNTDGIELTILSNLKGKIPLVNSASANYSRYWAEKQSGDFDSYYALDYIKHSLKFGLNHQIISNLSAAWNFSWQQREGRYNSIDNISKAYTSFWLIDLKLSWTAANYSVYAEGSNLFNKDYVDIGNVIQPGRWISFGFNYKFTW
jgi:iron complex outermembrane receptor protein